MSTIAAPVGLPESTSQLRRIRTAALVALGAAVLGAAAGMMAAGGRAWEAIVLVGIALPVMLWRRPQLGPVMILGAGLLIEQFPVNLQNNGATALANVPITNTVPLFHGLGSFHLEPADLLLIVVLLVYLLRSSGDESRWWPRSHVTFGMVGLVLALLIGEAVGLSHHGQLRESFTELRPFFYLVFTYVLTSVLIRTHSAVQAMLWTIVGAEAIKSIQALYLFAVTRSFHPHPESLLAHEEAMFFSLFFFMVLGLWLFGLRGRLRTVATSLLPLVFAADLVNDRRTAWLILAFGLIVMLVVTYVVRPDRRRLIRRIAGVIAVLSAVYFPAFWNCSGSLGQPASGLRSAIGQPDARDVLSDDYRVQENANLELNLKNAGPLGVGFGVQIIYALPMPGLVDKVDPAILYVPHNGVLYILMRMGLIGGVAFWALVGAAIIAGCRLARCPDPRLAMIGALSAAVVFGWTLEGATDQGFVLSRVTFTVGCMLGLAEAAKRIYASQHVGGRRNKPLSIGSIETRPALESVPVWGDGMTMHAVTLQINAAPTDAPHLDQILPHELRQLGRQVDEILVTIDLTRGPLVDPDVWSRGEVAVREIIERCQEDYPHLRTLDVDTSPEVAQQVADEFFGGEPIPDKDWRGAPIYPYFFGLWASRNRYVFHMDSDMLYGGGSQSWISEAVDLLRSRPDVLVCSPLPGPPTADGGLVSQTLAREPFQSLAFRADQVSTRVMMIDRGRFRDKVATLRILPPPRRMVWLARLDGYAPSDRAEILLSQGMLASGLCRIDFLGSKPGMWSVHPPHRSPLFYRELPRLVRRIESGDVPELQRGQHDVHDSMIDWSSARKPRWRRLARHGELALRNLSGTRRARPSRVLP